MVQNMSNQELNLLFVIGLLWNAAFIYLCIDLGIGFAYNNWFFSGWIIYFFAGYYCARIVNGTNKKWIYCLGAGGFAVTVLGRWLIPDNYQYSTDLAPAFLLFTIAVYTFFEREIVIRNDYLKKVIKFMTKHSFLVYMLHWHVLHKITPLIVAGKTTVLEWIACVLVTLVISVLLSVFLDMAVIYPVQKLMRKRLFPV